MDLFGRRIARWTPVVDDHAASRTGEKQRRAQSRSTRANHHHIYDVLLASKRFLKHTVPPCVKHHDASVGSA